MENSTIQPKKVFQTIDENLQALQQVNYEELPEKEKELMREKLEELYELAMSIKKDIQVDSDSDK